MTLDDAQLEILVQECSKLKADETYKSPSCYAILSYMIQQLIKIYGYHRYPTEKKEQLELDAIIRCYRKIPRFNLEKANEARAKSGLKPDIHRAWHRYCQVIITSSFLTSFSSMNRKQVVLVPIEIFGLSTSSAYVDLDHEYVNKTCNEVKASTTYELAFLQKEDIEAILDAETVAARAKAFEERLATIEKELSTND